MCDDDKALVEQLRSHDYDCAYNPKTDEQLYAERDEAADHIEALSAEVERLHGTLKKIAAPLKSWETRSRHSEWAQHTARAALGESHDQ